MTDQIKAIVIGAYPRFVQKIEKKLTPFLDFKLIMTNDRIKPDVVPDAKVVVILTDYVGRGNAGTGWDIARARKIPVVECRSENYVRAELEKLNLIKNGQNKNEVPVPAEKAAAPVEEKTSIGLSHDQILQYLPEASKLVKALLEPGERADESLFLPLLSEGIGLPIDIVKSLLLPEIAATGLIQNTVGTTWKRTGGNSSEEEAYQHVEDKVEAPKPKVASRRDYYVSKIGGLHPGPYRSLYAISQELAKYSEFLRENGALSSDTYRLVIVKHAANEGLIEEKDGQFFVMQDDSIKLTPLPTVEAPKKKEAPKVKKEEIDKVKEVPQPVRPETSSLPTTFTPLHLLKGVDERESSTVVPAASSAASPASRSGFGRIDVNAIPIQLKTLKNLMPQMFWDEMAFRAVSARMLSAKVDGRPPGKDSFDPAEWDALAWEQLQKLPLAMVVPTWMPDNFKDERLICSGPGCGADFVFTKSEQEHFYRMFGEVKRPKLCTRCRRLRKEGKLPIDDDSAGEHILRRYGGQ